MQPSPLSVQQPRLTVMTGRTRRPGLEPVPAFLWRSPVRLSPALFFLRYSTGHVSNPAANIRLRGACCSAWERWFVGTRFGTSCGHTEVVQGPATNQSCPSQTRHVPPIVDGTLQQGLMPCGSEVTEERVSSWERSPSFFLLTSSSHSTRKDSLMVTH